MNFSQLWAAPPERHEPQPSHLSKGPPRAAVSTAVVQGSEDRSPEITLAGASMQQGAHSTSPRAQGLRLCEVLPMQANTPCGDAAFSSAVRDRHRS
jgi:hypothetical protein